VSSECLVLRSWAEAPTQASGGGCAARRSSRSCAATRRREVVAARGRYHEGPLRFLALSGISAFRILSLQLAYVDGTVLLRARYPVTLAPTSQSPDIMSMADTEIDFSHLTPEQRLDLIAALWDSIPPADAEPISPELARELERRVAEMERDPEAGHPWEEVLADLRKRLG